MTLINGHQQHTIDVLDRGLAYGDGLFETIAVIDGSLHYWDLHWQRLQNGAKRLTIELPDEDDLLTQINSEIKLTALQENSAGRENGTRQVVKLIISRGSGGRGYLFPEIQHPSVIIMLHPWPERETADYEKGIHAMVCQTRLASQPALAGIKHLNRLEQVLARNELHSSNKQQPDYQEGIMLSCCASEPLDSLVIEGTSSNLFFVLDGLLCTAKIDNCGVLGTMREAVISLISTSLTLKVQQGHYSLQQLSQATEVFFTNSIYGILPVASITVNDSLQWCYTERLISSQLSAILNKELKHPTQFS